MKEPEETRADIIRGIAKPRMTKSARIAELNLDTTRIAERPSTSVNGIVNKIILSPRSNERDKAQISVDLPDRRYRELRIENTLTDEHGDEFQLKRGAHVEVIVVAKPPGPQLAKTGSRPRI